MRYTDDQKYAIERIEYFTEMYAQQASFDGPLADFYLSMTCDLFDIFERLFEDDDSMIFNNLRDGFRQFVLDRLDSLECK